MTRHLQLGLAVALTPAAALAQAAEEDGGGSSPAFWIAILAVFISLGVVFVARRKK